MQFLWPSLLEQMLKERATIPSQEASALPSPASYRNSPWNLRTRYICHSTTPARSRTAGGTREASAPSVRCLPGDGDRLMPPGGPSLVGPMARQHCGELETIPADGTRGLMWGPGLWTGWGAPGGQSRLVVLSWPRHIDGVMASCSLTILAGQK